MERTTTPSFTSRASIDPRFNVFLRRTQHEECMREVTNLLSEQLGHIQKVIDIQRRIQDTMQGYGAPASPHIPPSRLRNSIEGAVPYKKSSQDSPKATSGRSLLSKDITGGITPILIEQKPKPRLQRVMTFFHLKPRRIHETQTSA